MKENVIQVKSYAFTEGKKGARVRSLIAIFPPSGLRQQPDT